MKLLSQVQELSVATTLQFNGLDSSFTVTRTSGNPLIIISQMLVDSVTTEMNGSTIYCSEDGNENENGVPMATITVMHQ